MIPLTNSDFICWTNAILQTPKGVSDSASQTENGGIQCTHKASGPYWKRPRCLGADGSQLPTPFPLKPQHRVGPASSPPPLAGEKGLGSHVLLCPAHGGLWEAFKCWYTRVTDWPRLAVQPTMLCLAWTVGGTEGKKGCQWWLGKLEGTQWPGGEAFGGPQVRGSGVLGNC